MQGVAGDDSHCPDSRHGWPMCHDCPEQWFQYGLMYSKCDNVRAPSQQKRSLTDRLTFDSTINTLHLLQQNDEQNSINKNRTVTDRLTESSATLEMTWLRMGPGTEQKGPGLWADARASKSSKTWSLPKFRTVVVFALLDSFNWSVNCYCHKTWHGQRHEFQILVAHSLVHVLLFSNLLEFAKVGQHNQGQGIVVHCPRSGCQAGALGFTAMPSPSDETVFFKPI